LTKDFNKLTVFFEEPFWVGVFERYEDGKISACKVTFGAEPKDFEVYEYVLRNYYNLKFSPAVASARKEEKKNPKRILREVRKSVTNLSIGTKSQQALKLLQEQNKLQRKVKTRQKKLEEAERKFELRQQKKKEKHKGR